MFCSWSPVSQWVRGYVQTLLALTSISSLRELSTGSKHGIIFLRVNAPTPARQNRISRLKRGSRKLGSRSHYPHRSSTRQRSRRRSTARWAISHWLSLQQLRLSPVPELGHLQVTAPPEAVHLAPGVRRSNGASALSWYYHQLQRATLSLESSLHVSELVRAQGLHSTFVTSAGTPFGAWDWGDPPVARMMISQRPNGGRSGTR